MVSLCFYIDVEPWFLLCDRQPNTRRTVSVVCSFLHEVVCKACSSRAFNFTLHIYSCVGIYVYLNFYLLPSSFSTVASGPQKKNHRHLLTSMVIPSSPFSLLFSCFIIVSYASWSWYVADYAARKVSYQLNTMPGNCRVSIKIRPHCVHEYKSDNEWEHICRGKYSSGLICNVV